VGALFWRMFRCARIIFSLRFHMGQWSPQESIDFLVDRVGHERDNATAEVRRSFEGGYSPLYQAAYLLGALQLRSLHKELVDSKIMTNKAINPSFRTFMRFLLICEPVVFANMLTSCRKNIAEVYGDVTSL